MSNSQYSNGQAEVRNSSKWLRAEVKHLLRDLRHLAGNKSQTINPWRQNIYDQLLPYFASTALEYVNLAEKVIPIAQEDSMDYCYNRVLQEITEHVRLLLSIRAGDVATEPQSLQQNLNAFQAIIWHIAQYVPSTNDERPLLIPILSNRFMYFHLNYVNGMGIIGVPPDALVRPYHDLAILWHEVAGHWVAQQAANANFLKKRTLELNKRLHEVSVWSCYRDMYKRSIQQRLTVKLDINEDSLTIAGIAGILNYFAEHNPKRQETTIDTDLEWQKVWFGQILADLVGVQALGDTMAKSLRSALSRAYAHQDLGDLHHPPPSLRIEIARKYLEANHVGTLGHKGQELNEVDKLAKVIVDCIRTEYPEMAGMAPPNDGIIPLVKNLVQETLDGQNVQRNVNDLITYPEIAGAFKQSQASAPSIKRSNLIWSQAGFTQPERDKFKKSKKCDNDVEAQRYMEQLRRIKFTKTDGSTDQGETPSKPPPEFFPGFQAYLYR